MAGLRRGPFASRSLGMSTTFASHTGHDAPPTAPAPFELTAAQQSLVGDLG